MSSGGSKSSFKYSPSPHSPKHMFRAYKDLGLVEWVEKDGTKKSNPQVEKYIELVAGKRMNAMTTAWCAFWVGGILEQEGHTSTKSGMARSYLKWGTLVEDLDDCKEGDIIVLWRGSHDDGVTGHVGFFVGRDTTSVYLLGGNQGDQVSIQKFPLYKVLGQRRIRKIKESKTIKAAAAETVNQAVLKPAVDQGIPDKLGEAKTSLEQAVPMLDALSDWKPYLKIILHTASVLLILGIVYFRWQDYEKGRT